MDEEDGVISNNTKSPMRRLGSTRKQAHFNNIRLQLNEQLRCLDLRMETQTSVIGELQDYFRKRAEVELDYSKSLDKLAKSLQLRHKEQKAKREQWSLVSSFSCWTQLVSQTKAMSRDHALLAEIFSTHVINRFTQITEDVQRIYKKCRDIGYELHEELMRVLRELHATTKTYLSYQAEARAAETKLRATEAARAKVEQSLPKEKLEKSKKYRVVEKEVQKRKNKYFDAKLKALKARNEYTLCLESSNATIHKYFVEDLSDLIDCMDFGFHHCVSRALFMYISAEEGRQKSETEGLQQLQSLVQGMDSRLDKQKFMEFNHSAFMIPKKFEFQGQKDEQAEPELQRLLCAEMETRLAQINSRLTSLKTESEEIWKTLETAEISLLDMLTAKDYDCSTMFGSDRKEPPSEPESVTIKLRADRHETEEFYLTKLREYLLGTSRIARLDTKQAHIRQSLLEQHNSSAQNSPHSLASPSSEFTTNGESCNNGSPINGSLLQTASTKPVRRKRIGGGRYQLNAPPKLFGGSLEEYVEATGQEIPLVVRSCIRVINLYGLHHQGIFRVSGSQLEINNFKESFEKGEDALADITDASDMNSIAGVFKLYLRELREPLFPLMYFEQFMQLSQLESKHEFVVRLRDILSTLPRPSLLLLRYVFYFLNHLAEYSDENMMDPYNLAICFGPTLVPVPDDKDQVQYQNQVNELIKNVILFADDIFPSPSLLPGLVYEKYLCPSLEEDEDIGECPSDVICCPSEDECDSLEATAQFEFLARSNRELSLKKGDHITLFNQVSNDWWKGSVAGQEGLIPDKYIMLKIKDESAEKLCDASAPNGGGGKLSSSSASTTTTGSSCDVTPANVRRRRVSSSNDSVVSGSHSGSGGGGEDRGAWSLQYAPSPGGDNTSETSSLDDSGRHSLGPDDCLILPDGRYSPGYDRLSRSLQRELETKFKSGVSMATGGRTYSEGGGAYSERGAVVGGYADKGGAYSVSMTTSTATGGGAYHTMGGARGRSHWKSASVDEKQVMKMAETKDDSCVSEKVEFSQNRELWKRRASSHTQLSGGALSLSKEGDVWSESGLSKESSQWTEGLRHSKDTPDLVMDLPDLSQKTRLSRDDAPLTPSSSSEPESPDMSTTAERFAKHQCTLRKNTKSSPSPSPPCSVTSSELSESVNETEPKSHEGTEDTRSVTEISEPTPQSQRHSRSPERRKSPVPAERLLSVPPGDKPPVLTPKPALMRKPVITQHSPLVLRKFQTRSPEGRVARDSSGEKD